MLKNIMGCLKEFKYSSKKNYIYSLPLFEKKTKKNISRLPISIRIILESVIRNCDNEKITDDHIFSLASWEPNSLRTNEIPFTVSRVILQDFTGIPLLADLAAMRGVAKNLGKNPKNIEPIVPVDLVVDHSVQIDHYKEKNSLELNMKIEFQRNNERYQFMKWGMQAFNSFGVVPPGFGIVHQVNLEYLAKGVHLKNNLYYPDTLVGTDSHTTMINGLGVVGWGVGGIEAEAAMLGQPIYLLTPDVVGINLLGSLRDGVTATDLVLTITEILRKEKVVGKFVEFFGEGTSSITLTDRATISNMAPEYGATIGFFPVDDETIKYFKNTGRDEQEVQAFKKYFQAQNLYGIPKENEIDYSKVIKIDLSNVAPSIAGPKRPQDRIEIGNVKDTFINIFSKPIIENGFNKKIKDIDSVYRNKNGIEIKNGDILLASITSCTNTSNPSVLIGAGLLAKKAVSLGLEISAHVKTSMAPGSKVVTEYLSNSGLLKYLEKLGFIVTAYGCATCIGNSGDLSDELNEIILENDIVASAILSGNRNFEARIHPNIKANFLASPPLVVAYALAGNITIDLMTEPIGKTKNNENIFIGDIWPSQNEINKYLKYATNSKTFINNYSKIKKSPGKLWENISKQSSGDIYNWPKSTYIAEPPFFKNFEINKINEFENIINAKALAIFGNSITTDHISPAGSIKEDSPAGKWLKSNQVLKSDFNSYGSRRGNHEIMIRGTFANIRLKNLMIPLQSDGSRIEGGYTIYHPEKKMMTIYDAAIKYMTNDVPTIIFAGEEYGTGSSRDWAAKGTQLLGVKVVIANSFERIHRSNLVGMGVLPLQFISTDNISSLKICGDETFNITGIDSEISPQKKLELTITRASGEKLTTKVLLRLDTPIEVNYFLNGGILPFVLRELLAA